MCAGKEDIYQTTLPKRYEHTSRQRAIMCLQKVSTTSACTVCTAGPGSRPFGNFYGYPRTVLAEDPFVRPDGLYGYIIL